MKHFICSLLLFPLFSNAQQLAFGFKNGITTSQLIGDEYRGYNQIGYGGGLTSQLRLSRDFRLKLDALFITKGCYSKINGKNGSLYQANVELLYIEFPLLLVYNYKKLILELGPGFGYLVKQREYIPGTTFFNLLYPFSPTEKSIHTGIGVYFNKQWGGLLRYSHSLVPVRTDPSVQYNSVFTASIFFLASFKKKD